MKLTLLPLLTTGAVALVLPPNGAPDQQQTPVTVPQHEDKQPDEGSLSSLWEAIFASADSVSTAVHHGLDLFNEGLEAVTEAVDEVETEGHGHHGFPDLTIYQLIQASNHTKKFAALVDEHEDVVKLLNSTGSSNITLFVPVDAAFDDIPDHDKPGKEFINAVLRYHIGLGDYSAFDLVSTNTIPTAYDEKALGDEPQRLRASVGLHGVSINFYSSIVVGNIRAKNGAIHAIRHVLAPPPYLGRILTLFPSEFSTLLLAYEKTDFVKFIHGVNTVGSTLFAPSNNAFAALGPKINAFLFNTERGLKSLKALLKYHIAPNATLYSDTFYDKTGDSDAEGWERDHYDLATLLDEKHVGVDTATFAGFTAIRVNGFANVAVRDAPGKNGVLHVLDKVLIPPYKHEEKGEGTAGEISVEELVERLEGYVDEDNHEDGQFNELEL